MQHDVEGMSVLVNVSSDLAKVKVKGKKVGTRDGAPSTAVLFNIVKAHDFCIKCLRYLQIKIGVFTNLCICIDINK